MKRFHRLGAALAASALFFTGCDGKKDDSKQTKTQTLTILETSDLHSNVMPWNYFEAKVDEKVGLAKVATLVAAERAANPCTVLVDNGDTIQGTPLGTRYALVDTTSKHPMAAAMNAVGYDAMTVGNHEFNYGLTTLGRFKGEANFPLLSANITSTFGLLPFSPYVIKDVCGVKVAIIGLTTPGISVWEEPVNVPGLSFDLPIPAATKYVAEAKAAGAEVIVVAFHAGPDKQPPVTDAAGWLSDRAAWVSNGSMAHENDVLELAEQVPGIDVILTGHTHMVIPKIVVGNTVIVQPNRWGSHLAKATITVDNAEGPYKVRSRDSQLVPVDATVSPNAAVVSAIQTYHDATLAYVDEVIGSTVAEFPGGDAARFTDSALADFINAVQLDAAAKAGHPAQVSLAAIFNNTGKLPAGTVKLRDAYSAYVYDNTLYVMEITGQILKDALEQDAKFFVKLDMAAMPATGTAAKDPAARDYNWDLYSGIDYTIDLTKDVGTRVTSLKLGGADVTPDQKIVIALNNYRAGGGGGFSMFKQGTLLWRSVDGVRDFIAEYVKTHPNLDPNAFNTCNFTLVPNLFSAYFPGQPQKCAPFAATANGGSTAMLMPGDSATLEAAAPPVGFPTTGWVWTWSDGLTGARQGSFTINGSSATYSPASCVDLGFGPQEITLTATGASGPFTGSATVTVMVHCPTSVTVKVLALNDFHGQLSSKTVSGRPAGGAAVVSSYLKTAMAGKEATTVIVEAGDMVGASPANSALLEDEPTISFFNSFGNATCHMVGGVTGGPYDPACNLIGIAGNHEFDEGTAELARLLGGGNHANGPFLDDPWGGAHFPVLSSNITLADGSTLFRPYLVKSINGVKVAFIGATYKDTPSIVLPTSIVGLTFGDEAAAINAQVALLQAQGIHAFVVVLHNGGIGQTKYAGPTNPAATGLSADIVALVGRLDADVDVVVSAHSHSFANQLVKNAGNNDVLVTQAFSAGTAYADIDITVDGLSQDVSAKTASIVDTFGDAGPGLTPDPAMVTLVAAANAKVAPIAGATVTTSTAVITKVLTNGEAPLGDLIADTHRATMGTDLGITNPGGLRADLPAGTITWNDCFTAQPFANIVMKATITGQQLHDVLEQQWTVAGAPKFLQISGFTYQWSAGAAVGSKLVAGSLKLSDGTVIDPAASYTVALNNFLQGGGDGFTTFKSMTGVVAGPIDIDALVTYLKAQPAPISPSPGGRIVPVP